SYGWQGKMVEQLMGMLGNLKVEVIDPVLVKGKPVDQTFRELNHLADAIITKHREAGLITTN
ncbi:MAG: FprA family A-type flavoprotein, partial [Candidatus Hodarchaeales archaeon]